MKGDKQIDLSVECKFSFKKNCYSRVWLDGWNRIVLYFLREIAYCKMKLHVEWVICVCINFWLFHHDHKMCVVFIWQFSNSSNTIILTSSWSRTFGNSCPIKLRLYVIISFGQIDSRRRLLSFICRHHACCVSNSRFLCNWILFFFCPLFDVYLELTHLALVRFRSEILICRKLLGHELFLNEFISCIFLFRILWIRSLILQRGKITESC